MIIYKICNTVGCTSTATKFSITTDEAPPTGQVMLEAQAAGSNQINMKWFADPILGFKPNGAVLYSVLVEGPFLTGSSLVASSAEKVVLKRLNKPFVQVSTRNMLNTTVSNTIYGILDGILAFSNYNLVVNASNTQGFVISNQVNVETFKSGPSDLLTPQFVSATSTSIKLEWFEPILINSNDPTIFYKVFIILVYLFLKRFFHIIKY